MQDFIIRNKKRVLIIYEGRDAAGKGGTISRTIAKLNPKKYKVVALPKPTEIESKQWYFQRYIQQFPIQEEIAFFDRSWYNRAVVEPVFGFCTEEQYKDFLVQVLVLEHLLIQEGIILIKFFLNISKEEQEKRLEDRKNDELKQWKVGSLDQQAQEKWEVYSHYINEMLDKTSSEISPWIEIKTDDKQTARLETMKYIVNRISEFQTLENFILDENVVIQHV